MASQESATENTPNQRLLSIDALRGFDMFWIIGGDAIFLAIAKAGNWSFSPVIIEQLEHADWEGFRFYDLIFPLFLFMVGCVIPFSLDKFRSNPSTAYRRLLWRTFVLLMFGMIYNGILQFNWSNLRYPGVLQRIAICYGIASVLYLNLNWKARIGLAAAILVGYWGLIGLIQVDGALGVYSKEGNLSGYVDRNVLPGKILPQYYGYGDNEGLLSTIPAIVTALLGVFAGEWLRGNRDRWRTAAGVAIAGVALLGGGYAWSFSFPVIKNIWSSSFVLVAGGWSCLLLALFYTLIDVLGWKRWAFFWIVIGTNAITIYMLQRVIDFDDLSKFFLGGVSGLSGAWGPVVLAIGVIALKWILLLFLHRQKLFLRV